MSLSNGTDATAEMLSFNLKNEASRLGPRVGKIICRGRPAISTPAFVASTSRGVIPHVTPDLVQKHTSILATYAGLEDFIEKSRQDAPIFNVPSELAIQGSTLRAYTGLSDTSMSILGPRRVPRLNTPHHSTNTALSISTSFGFASLELEDYNKAIKKLGPDVSITFADLVQEDKISRKRIQKSADRTHAWLRDTVDEFEKNEFKSPLFASILPLEPQQQQFYLSDLVAEYKHRLSGICVFEPTSIPDIPESLITLPILCLSDPKGPHDILHAVSLGADLITIPFVTTTSEAGIAFTFTFAASADARNEPLGTDMWSPSNATDTSSLAPNCSCYTCTRHHKAYLHHLLQAKEMLAWTLLQIHNFHVVAQFLQDIRRSIANGTFDHDSKPFRLAYEVEIALGTGEGPRVRGYQVRSLGPGEPKKNIKGYNKFDDQALKLEEAESGVATPEPEADAAALESQGLGQKAQ